ncbi:MAG: rod shape-determining protein MreD [Phocaeicola sp.]
MVLFIQRVGWFISLLLLQALILNNVHIEGYATPYFFIYFVLKQYSGIGRNSLMLWAFLLGLGVDIFGNTPGVHASALTLLAFIRPQLLKVCSQRDDIEEFTPGVFTMGLWNYTRYGVLSSLLFTTFILVMDTFSFDNYLWLLVRIGTGTLSTLLCIYCAEGIKGRES